MITKEKAREIAEKYLILKEREYSNLCLSEQVAYWPKKEILFGKYEGSRLDVFSVNYGTIWGNEERSEFIVINAETGDVLYSMDAHGWVEEMEDE